MAELSQTVELCQRSVVGEDSRSLSFRRSTGGRPYDPIKIVQVCHTYHYLGGEGVCCVGLSIVQLTHVHCGTSEVCCLLVYGCRTHYYTESGVNQLMAMKVMRSTNLSSTMAAFLEDQLDMCTFRILKNTRKKEAVNYLTRIMMYVKQPLPGITVYRILHYINTHTT